MVMVLKYGSGVPWDRLERLEASLAVPLAAATAGTNDTAL